MTPIPARPVIAPVPHHNYSHSHQYSCTCESPCGDIYSMCMSIGISLLVIGMILMIAGTRMQERGKYKKGSLVEDVGFFFMFSAMLSPFLVAIILYIVQS